MIKVIGIGSGEAKNLTLEAIEAIKSAEVIVGYRTYIEWIQPLIDKNGKVQKVITTGMTGEVKRCQAALEASKKGENVVVISSGDSGIYGMVLIRKMRFVLSPVLLHQVLQQLHWVRL